MRPDRIRLPSLPLLWPPLHSPAVPAFPGKPMNQPPALLHQKKESKTGRIISICASCSINEIRNKNLHPQQIYKKTDLHRTVPQQMIRSGFVSVRTNICKLYEQTETGLPLSNRCIYIILNALRVRIKGGKILPKVRGFSCLVAEASRSPFYHWQCLFERPAARHGREMQLVKNQWDLNCHSAKTN